MNEIKNIGIYISTVSPSISKCAISLHHEFKFRNRNPLHIVYNSVIVFCNDNEDNKEYRTEDLLHSSNY